MKKTKGKIPVLSVNLEIQNELAEETPSEESPLSRVEAQKENKVQDQMQATMIDEVAHTQKSSPIEGMIAKLSEEIKKGFSVSEANQANIRKACEILELFFDLLAKRTQVLEDTVEVLRGDVESNKRELRQLKCFEQLLQEKLERLENVERRNNLRILNIPEGVEGDNIKTYIGSIIKSALQLDETDMDIVADIQRIHRDPLREIPLDDIIAPCKKAEKEHIENDSDFYDLVT
ncbi:hypothetical protein NDU88_008628 [Pleurodeles waltl]|uniref:Uncharacterized protein n=1 Tax=Pleurodeles waltl TaxID=8319 RepID=A0AAV7P454_PLEWA|nr:hypothetical protein NDU88_008628 [Pleurodeles waltl]